MLRLDARAEAAHGRGRLELSIPVAAVEEASAPEGEAIPRCRLRGGSLRFDHEAQHLAIVSERLLNGEVLVLDQVPIVEPASQCLVGVVGGLDAGDAHRAVLDHAVHVAEVFERSPAQAQRVEVGVLEVVHPVGEAHRGVSSRGAVDVRLDVEVLDDAGASAGGKCADGEEGEETQPEYPHCVP